MAKKTTKSKKVFLFQKEMLISLLLTLGLYYLFYFVVNWTLPCKDQAMDRLLFGVKWLIFPVACLWFGILVIVILKVFSGESDPLFGRENEEHKNHVHYVQNSVYNVLLLFFAVVLISLYMPAKNMALVPAVCIIYSIGRLLYWYGICQGSVHSYFGRLMTLLTNVAPLMYLTVRILVVDFIQC